MNSTKTNSFEQALERHSAGLSRTTADAFEATLTEHIEEPAIGVPLPFEDVSIESLPVETSPSPEKLDAARTSVTPVEFGVADYGSVLVTSGMEGTEQVSLYADRHVAVLRERDIIPDMAAAFDRLDAGFSNGMTSAVIATGPSATADMGELVYGAHGPQNVHVILLTD